MATGVASWSSTAATNATADSAVNWAEGQAPSTVNDSGRGMMASVAKWRDDHLKGITAGGTSTAYTVTTNQSFASLAALDGQVLAVTVSSTSGASPTLAVDGLTAKAINKTTGVAVPAGGLIAGNTYHVQYSSANSEYLVLNYRTVQLSDLTNSTTGTGSVVLANTPTLVTPIIGAATGTSLSVSGSVTAASLTVAGSVTADTLSAAGLVTVGSVSTAGRVTAASFSTGGSVTANTIVVGSTITSGAFLYTGGDPKVDAFPSGTLMLFQQTSAPTGWTKSSAHNNKALRIVSGTASSGGTTAFTSIFAARTITQANLPNVNLTTTITDPGHVHAAPSGGSFYVTIGAGTNIAGTAGGATATNTASATTGITASTSLGGSGTTMDFAVQYVDVIIASKD